MSDEQITHAPRYYSVPDSIMCPTVAFDVDNTLVDSDGNAREEVVQLFKLLHSFGCRMFIWSNGSNHTTGKQYEEYAAEVRDRLGLVAQCVPKGSFRPDITVDDLDAFDRISERTLGHVNIKV